MIDQKLAYNNILNAGVALQLDENVVAGRVKQQALLPEVNIVGRYVENPMLNFIIYEVDFPDSQLKDYLENVIANNMLSQVYDEGYSVTLID